MAETSSSRRFCSEVRGVASRVLKFSGLRFLEEPKLGEKREKCVGDRCGGASKSAPMSFNLFFAFSISSLIFPHISRTARASLSDEEPKLPDRERGDLSLDRPDDNLDLLVRNGDFLLGL